MRTSLKTLIKATRNVSTKIPTKQKLSANEVKSLNSESKALFGAVRKDSKASISQNKNVLEKNDNSSEIFWLTKHRARESKIEPARCTKKIIAESSKSSPNETLDTSASAINFIPFSQEELKKILMYPLHTNSHTILEENKNVSTKKMYYPSVSKILQATMSEASRLALINWKASKIAELGLDGFNQLQKETFLEGREFHSAVQDYLTVGSQPAQDSPIIRIWESIFPALDSLKLQVRHTEVPIEHPFLKYRGIVDCVSESESNLSVIEWKTSEKQKRTVAATFDAPIQLCAYLGALSADPRYDLISSQGFVVVAYKDGSPASVHKLEEVALRNYWARWVNKVQEFWIRTRDGTLPEPI